MTLNEAIRHELERLEQTKTFKKETIIESAQGGVVRVAGRDVIMLASNNYLGLASHPRIREAAMRGLREYGHGVASVRFLCGTQTTDVLATISHRWIKDPSELKGMELFHPLVADLIREAQRRDHSCA